MSNIITIKENIMTVFFNQDKVLDPERCWSDWIELGSLGKVRKHYNKIGIVSTRTGECPNESAIQKAAYTWAVSSPETLQVAKERFEFECRERAIIPSDEMWNEKLYKIGRLLYYQRANRMKEFIEMHGLQAYAPN
jgi:hypothetical protein